MTLNYLKNLFFYSLLAALSFSIFSGCKKKATELKPEPTDTVPAKRDTPKVYIDTNITRFYKRKTGLIASDGGTTIKLDNGYVLWFYGDTYYNVYRESDGTTPCLFGIRSTALYQPYNNWDPAQTETFGPPAGENSLFMSNKTKGYWNWPANGVQIGDTVYIYAASFKQVSGGLGFDYGGNDVIAKMVLPNKHIVAYHELQDFNKIWFTVGMVKEPDGYVYAFGSRQTFLSADIFVGRFPTSNPNALWDFWDGKGWTKDVKAAKAIMNAPSTSNHIAKIKNKFVMFSSEFSLGCDGGTKIWVTVGNGLTGPFTEKKVIYSIPDKVDGHTPFFYGPIPHPEYINEKNELLLTYSINGYSPCVPSCVNGRFNPDYYRPRGIRIPLELIDPGL